MPDSIIISRCKCGEVPTIRSSSGKIECSCGVNMRTEDIDEAIAMWNRAMSSVRIDFTLEKSTVEPDDPPKIAFANPCSGCGEPPVTYCFVNNWWTIHCKVCDEFIHSKSRRQAVNSWNNLNPITTTEPIVVDDELRDEIFVEVRDAYYFGYRAGKNMKPCNGTDYMKEYKQRSKLHG